MAGLIRRSLPWLLVLLIWMGVTSAVSSACPFCGQQGRTLTDEVKQAALVLYGKMTTVNDDGTATKMEIEAIVKKPENQDDARVLGDGKSIWIPRSIKLDQKEDRFLVFCDVFKGKLDAYRGIQVKANSSIAKYLKGALAVENAKSAKEDKDGKIGKRLRFFFKYLDDPDIEVSNDAYKEFANADYRDYQGMARDLPADKIAGWIDPNGKQNTMAFRYGLYGSLLGHCGKAKHAALLRRLLEDKDRPVGGGVDGLLAGYIMLEPKEGWKYLQNILHDTKREFLFRYAALKTARFLWQYRSDLVSHKELVKGLVPLLEQADAADLVIEDLRRWEQWDQADRVLSVRGTKAYETPVVRRAVLRFALSCKGSKEAEAHVAAERRKDPMNVADVEELLKLDQTPPPGPQASK
jgi:hypothetical protein